MGDVTRARPRPDFFASVGAEADLQATLSPSALGLGAALFVVAVAGKVLAGYAPWWFRGHMLLVGIAMVIATTFVTPPLLGWVAGAPPDARPPAGLSGVSVTKRSAPGLVLLE